MSQRTKTQHLKVNEHTMQRALKKRLPAIHPCTLLLVVFLLCPVHRAAAQIFSDVQINASPNPVGSGARAQGMGGAFIAVADDATAASWNPGGLTQLERPEFSIVGSYAYRQRHVNSSSHPEADGWNSVTREDLNYLSCALPFRAFDKNFVVSLNYQRLYDFYNKLSFNYDFRSTGNSGIFQKVETKTDFNQTGALKAFAPAIAVQLTPRLSVGATFNFWTDNLGYNNGWQNVRKVTGKGFALLPNGKLVQSRYQSITKEKNENFEAFNMNLGFLWQVNRVITIGGVFKTPFIADADRHTYSSSAAYTLGQSPPRPNHLSDNEHIRLKFPKSYGLGIAFRLSDALTVDVDVYRTEWSEFYVRAAGAKTNIAGDPWGTSHPGDTTQVRAGGEYLFILERTLVPVRFGLFYDPEPSTGHPKDYYGVSAGTGIMLGNVVLDCCYIYRWAEGVKSEVPNAARDDQQHTFLASMIVHF
jgi:long-subunit fatty acid transport protein